MSFSCVVFSSKKNRCHDSFQISYDDSWKNVTFFFVVPSIRDTYVFARNDV